MDLAEEYHGYGYDIGVFHAVECCGKRGFKRHEQWNPELRLRLCRKIAELANRCRVAGFVSTALKADYDAANHFVISHTGGLYPATLLSCLERVGSFARAIGESVFYWLERGDPNQNVADDILKRIGADQKLRERYAYYNHAIVPKGSDTIAMVAADVLAWECKQNFVELLRAAKDDEYHSDDRLTENFKVLRGDDPSRWFEVHTVGAGLDVRALTNAILQLK
jgi:hypothetical protein